MHHSHRQIVLLSDGTGNSRGKLEQTNVWRTYEALDLKDASEPELPRQFAFYDDGVGTSSFKPLALLGGALGHGLARNVLDLYEALCRVHRPGDRVFAFGFSRGAFTIRVLVGLISHQGLVPYHGDEGELRRLSLAAFRAYRRARYRLPVNWIEGPRALRDAALDAWARLRGRPRYRDVPRHRAVDIAFLGLWDTVAAYGMPVDEIATFINKVVYPLEMPDAHLSPLVRRAAHALAVDDERYTFHPKLWESEPRIAQVWFAGMHSDVGGGYADKGLAHVSLRWVLSQAAEAGLRLLPAIREIQNALADENGPMNDSRRGLAGYYRYKPRVLPGDAVVHRSVLRRIQVGQDGYAPIVLPAGFRIMDLDGTVAPAATWVPELALGAPGLPAVGGDASAYTAGRERALNRVWARRLVYFLTVLASVGLLAAPLVWSDAGAACTSDWCWLSPVVRGLDTVLPAAASRWTQWYAANPGTLLLLGGLTGGLLWLGSRIQRAVFDCMRRVWYAMPSVRPSSLANGLRPALPGTALGRGLAALRNHAAYQAWVRGMRHRVFPTLWGVALVGVAASLLCSLVFSMRNAAGDFCVGSAATHAPTVPIHGRFAARDLCAPTGAWLAAGATYDIRLTIQGTPSAVRCGDPRAWRDDDTPADWQGVRKLTLAHVLGWPLKREMGPAYFAPMARIGARGADVYALQPEPSQSRADLCSVLVGRIMAHTSGELFLYVNDAVGPPWRPELFYTLNNHGEAGFSVVQVPAPSAVPAADAADSAAR